MRRHALRIAVVSFVWTLTGCGSPFYRNAPLKQHAPEVGYRFDTLKPGDHNTDSTFICLTFSGGGTRAAALAYGVLLGLRETPLDPVNETPTDELALPSTPRMIDEVDVISAVSGGSFTAMGYGLWRDQLFDDRFKRRFLYRNVELDLLLKLLLPKNVVKAPFYLLDRIDVAATYYDEEIFDRHRYSDLMVHGRRPFIVVNATDLTRRQRFEFTQDDFDLLGSDLGRLPVGTAVAASAAFPFLLSPLRMKYYPGKPMVNAITDVLDAPPARRVQRRYRWAESLLLPNLPPSTATEASSAGGPADAARRIEIDERNHRYLYLLDGGLADNLGLSYVAEASRLGPIGRRAAEGKIKRFVIIVVDAATAPPSGLERKSSAPGLLHVGLGTATTAMESHGAALKGIFEYVLKDVQPRIRNAYDQCAESIAKGCPDAEPVRAPADATIESYLIDVNFHRVTDTKQRHSLLSTITSFFLPADHIDTLIETGRAVLLEHPEFQRLMRDLREEQP